MGISRFFFRSSCVLGIYLSCEGVAPGTSHLMLNPKLTHRCQVPELVKFIEGGTWVAFYGLELELWNRFSKVPDTKRLVATGFRLVRALN